MERRKPGLERSTRYHRTGLTRARVRDIWEVDCQGSLRCIMCQYRIVTKDGFWIVTYDSKGDTDECPNAPDNRVPIRSQPAARSR